MLFPLSRVRFQPAQSPESALAERRRRRRRRRRKRRRRFRRECKKYWQGGIQTSTCVPHLNLSVLMAKFFGNEMLGLEYYNFLKGLNHVIITSWKLVLNVLPVWPPFTGEFRLVLLVNGFILYLSRSLFSPTLSFSLILLLFLRKRTEGQKTFAWTPANSETSSSGQKFSKWRWSMGEARSWSPEGKPSWLNLLRI